MLRSSSEDQIRPDVVRSCKKILESSQIESIASNPEALSSIEESLKTSHASSQRISRETTILQACLAARDAALVDLLALRSAYSETVGMMFTAQQHLETLRSGVLGIVSSIEQGLAAFFGAADLDNRKTLAAKHLDAVHTAANIHKLIEDSHRKAELDAAIQNRIGILDHGAEMVAKFIALKELGSLVDQVGRIL